jgi:hypothetical protein
MKRVSLAAKMALSFKDSAGAAVEAATDRSGPRLGEEHSAAGSGHSGSRST